jgi:hypothetical protein
MSFALVAALYAGWTVTPAIESFEPLARSGMFVTPLHA